MWIPLWDLCESGLSAGFVGWLYMNVTKVHLKYR